MSQYDLIIIGGGPAGYTGAIRAAQLGFKTAVIEKRKTLGGTCLNVGCIPSKALLNSSEHYHQAKTKFEKHGIKFSGLELDLGQMMKRKEATVRQLTNGIAGLFKKHKIEYLNGLGRFKGINGDQKIVEVVAEDGSTKEVSAARVMIATGSAPIELPFLKFDGVNILSSTEALELTSVPKHLAIIGGGVIGLEMGSVWARLGSKVTVIEFQDRIMSGADKQVGLEFQKILAKQGFEFKLGTKCTGAKIDKGGIVLTAEDRATGAAMAIECDKVLVATGRRPYTDKLGLEAVGLSTDKAGRIEIDDHFNTKVAGIVAVGDVVRGAMLAHKAEEEAVVAVEVMAGQAGHINYQAIPGVVYTWPEFASVGLTEEELKEKGVAYKAGTFPFIANARAKTMDEVEGLVKILADAKTDRVYGVHIVGPGAGDLIAEAAMIIEFGGSAEDIARTSHAHPSLAESMKEAALAVDKLQRNI